MVSRKLESTTDDLNIMASNLKLTMFKGVFSMDTLPKYVEKETMFITNTDSSNLPGTHWIAVVIRHGRGYCFDPLGYPPPIFLKSWLNGHSVQWSYNSRQVQPHFTNLCGHFCIHFLNYCAKDYYHEVPYSSIVDIIYPVYYDKNIYEQSIIGFFKLR